MGLSTVYAIETDRLIIRCFKPDTDAPKLQEAIDESLPELLPWVPWAKLEPEPVSTKVERLKTFREKFDTGTDHIFGIFDKNDGKLLGSTGLHDRLGEKNTREIGYWVHTAYTRHGIATEAVKALTKIGFEFYQLDRIEIHCAEENIGSRKIPNKLGYLAQTKRSNVALTANMVWTMHRADYGMSSIRRIKLTAFGKDGKPVMPPPLS